MSYIGNTPTNQNFVAGSDQFNGTGSQTVFTLSRNVNTVNDIQVVVSNVPQDPFTAYSVAGNSLTFTSAPPAGTGNIYVTYRATNVQTFVPSPGVSPSVGNLNFIGTGNRITGDFSNATIANRVFWQTSTATANSFFSVIPTTAATSGVELYNQTDPTNASRLRLLSTQVDCSIQAAITGTGTYLPMTFYTGGSERARIATNGDFLFNSGYGSAAVAYGCRAWVNFNGTGTVAIRASGNVSSITDNGTGDYTVNFTTAMPDANLAAVATANEENGVPHYCNQTQPSTTTIRIRTYNSSAGASDCTFISVAVFR